MTPLRAQPAPKQRPPTACRAAAADRRLCRPNHIAGGLVRSRRTTGGQSKSCSWSMQR